MRQAGRYLPEFREIRKKNTDFIKLCLDKELSSEITLQPVNRLDVDSAIIFSDILMVPYAFGQEVNFVKDQGPKLSKFDFKARALPRPRPFFHCFLHPWYPPRGAQGIPWARVIIIHSRDPWGV